MAADDQEGSAEMPYQDICTTEGSMVDYELSPPCEEECTQQQACHESNFSLSFQRLWNSYRSHVQRHQVSLQLVDDLLTRIIFWAPPPSTHQRSTTSWREVMYGLISLHRLVMDLAVTHDEVINSYGTTLQPTAAPAVPATALRIMLTVTHNLMPTILELARSHPKRQTEYRLWLERIKFLMRLVLLTSYWNQMQNDPYSVVGGLLQDGGMYHVAYGGMKRSVPTTANVQALRYRREYVGRRTGRRVMCNGEVSSGGDGDEQHNRTLWMRLMVGEVLRLYRPLYWAQTERDESRLGDPQQLWKAWIVTLVMEIASLKCLSGLVSRDNPANQAELSRRRLKVLLYLLRSPAWYRTTEPSILRTTAIIRRVPLLGKLIESYLWEWLLYWKHPFVSEEE